jgi:hypothetical protein
MLMTERRKFNPDGPQKKPFYDTKRKVLVVPRPRSGIPASGIPASGIPASGEKTLNIPKKWEGLYRPPENEHDQNKLADRMLEWARKDDSRHIKLFFVLQGINPYKAFRLCETNEYFASCLQMAKVLVGSRMLDAATTRKEDGSVIMKYLPIVDEEYSQMLDKQRQAEASKMAVINLVAENIPDSPMVPKLKRGDVDESR